MAVQKTTHYVVNVEVIRIDKDGPDQYSKTEPKRVRQELGKFTVKNSDLGMVQDQAKAAIDLIQDGDFSE